MLGRRLRLLRQSPTTATIVPMMVAVSDGVLQGRYGLADNGGLSVTAPECRDRLTVTVDESIFSAQYPVNRRVCIRPHRERMNSEALDEKSKDAADPLRIVRVCDVDDRLRRPERVNHLPRPPHAGSHPDADALAKQFGNTKRAETERLAALLKVRAEAAASVNPTRVGFVEHIEALIADVDEYLRRSSIAWIVAARTAASTATLGSTVVVVADGASVDVVAAVDAGIVVGAVDVSGGVSVTPDAFGESESELHAARSNNRHTTSAPAARPALSARSPSTAAPRRTSNPQRLELYRATLCARELVRNGAVRRSLEPPGNQSAPQRARCDEEGRNDRRRVPQARWGRCRFDGTPVRAGVKSAHTSPRVQSPGRLEETPSSAFGASATVWCNE